MTNQVIPTGAENVAAQRVDDVAEIKLAAIIVALDPLERVTNWTALDDGTNCLAFSTVRKIRTILDSK